jgi:hypothetical protein
MSGVRPALSLVTILTELHGIGISALVNDFNTNSLTWKARNTETRGS